MARRDTAMLPNESTDAFYKKLQEGQQNWQIFCASKKSKAEEIAFLGQVRDRVILHLGTHGQISVELDRTTPLELDTSKDSAGKIVYPDGPARFKRFELPADVKTFTLYEGAVAPGVCFSDERVSFRTMMAVLRREAKLRPNELVKSMDVDPENYSDDPDYEINLSNHLVPDFYKHHWQARVYIPQVPLTAPMVARKNYPILKRLVTTVSEIKTAYNRLLEWHIVAFMIHDGIFYVIDLNPYIFPERLIEMARLRSGVNKRFNSEHKEVASDVRHRKKINATLYASTNTEKVVRLFSKTRHIICADSTCSVLRVEVPDGINGNDIDDGSADGVIDSIHIRRYKLSLRDMIDSRNVLEHRQDINKLISEIVKWYARKGIVVPINLQQLEFREDHLRLIREILTTVNDESIWIKPTVHPHATHALMDEIYQYMGQVIDTKGEEYTKLTNWLKTYMTSGVRRVAMAETIRERIAEERKRLGNTSDTSDDDEDEDDDDADDLDGSPKAYLKNDTGLPANISSFGVIAKDPSISTATQNSLLGKSARRLNGGKIKKSNKKQHKKYKNTRKGRRRTNKNKKKRANKTNKKKENKSGKALRII